MNKMTVNLLKKKFKIAFFGFYGRNNFGDDLFGFILQAICNSNSGFVSRIVGASAKRELENGFHLPVVRRFWIARGMFGALIRCATYGAAIVSADAVVFGGGTLFGAHASIGFAKFITNLGNRLQKPVAALGVSVGPFDSDERRQAFAGVFGRLVNIGVRDESSVEVVEELTGRRPENLGDLAFALPSIYTPTLPPRRSSTLIVSIHLADYTDTVLEIIKEVDRLRAVDEIAFLSLDDESVAVTGDIARLFEANHVRVSRYRYNSSITEVIDRIAGASCVLTSKLHGAITGYVYNVPTFLFCYQRKCVEFLNDRDLPGPREQFPPVADCITTVTRMLTGQVVAPRFQHAVEHFDAFGKFLSGVKSDLAGETVHNDS